MIPYQFSILRYLHNFSSEEFVNIGVVMWLPEKQRMLFSVNRFYSRISGFFSNFDGKKYHQTIRSIESRFDDIMREINNNDFQIDDFDKLKSVLIREDVSCFQWSHTMFGMIEKPKQRLNEIFYEFVIYHDKKKKRERHNESEIWSIIESSLHERKLIDKIEVNIKITSEEFSYKFKTGWHNGIRQVLEPISFDYLDNDSIINKAHTWAGRLLNLSNQNFKMTGVVAPPSEAFLDAYHGAIRILKKAPNVRTIVEEDEFFKFIPEIESDLGLAPPPYGIG